MDWVWLLVVILMVVPATVEAQTCGGKVNLIIGMDSSQSLESYQYEKITQFTTQVLQRLNFTDLSAVVAFAHQVQLVLDFNEFKNQSAVVKIQTYPHMNFPATRIDLFLSYGTNKYVTDARVDHQIPKVLLLVTDGRNTGTLESLRQAALEADRNNVDIITVGVGNSYSQFELLNMATFEENIIESLTFDGLLGDALNKSVERICFLSHAGYVTSKVCAGYFVLGIHIDVTDSNFVSTKLFLLDMIGNHIQFNHLFSDIVISVGKVGEKKRFSNTSGVLNFISQLQNDASSGTFDPVHAYQRLRPEFNDQDDFVENIAFFITDKQIDNFDKTKSYFSNTVRNLDNVDVLVTGIYPNINPDELLEMAGGMVMHRVLTTNTSFLTAGRNKLTDALCHMMEESPLEVIVEFSSATFFVDEPTKAPMYRQFTLKRYSVDLSGSSTVVVKTHSDSGSPYPATAGRDFMSVLLTVTFQPGETEKNISVLLFNDDEIENLEEFKMSIVSTTNAKIGKKNTTSIFITDKTELYKGPSEVILAFEYCPSPKGKDNIDTYHKYMNYIKKVAQHSEIGMDSVQITAETFCEESVTLTSSKSYMPTFHIPYGLQKDGTLGGLQQTLSAATSDVIALYDGLRTDNKILFPIFHENYQTDPHLNDVFQEAVSKGIVVMPIVLLEDSSSTLSFELPSGFTPYKVYLDALAGFNYQVLKTYIEQHVSLNATSQSGWSNIAITTNSEGLDVHTLAHLQTFVAELKKLYSGPGSPDIYDQNLQQDLQRFQEKPPAHVVRNTNLPIQRMMKMSENQDGVNVLLLIVTGPSTVPGVIETAAKARQMNIKIYIIGVDIDEGTEQELRNISGGNMQLIKSFSFSPLLILGTGRTIKDTVVTADSAHVMIAIDSSATVSSADFQKAVRVGDNLIRYWLTYLRLKNVKVTVGLFADRFIDLLTENLNGYTVNIQPKLQRPQHMNDLTSFSRVMLQMGDSLMASKESGDVTQVAILVAADTPVNTEFANRAKDMVTRDGVKLITVGINVPLFPESITKGSSVVSDSGEAAVTAGEIVNKLPSTGSYDVLLAVPADNGLSEETFTWVKRLTLQLTSNLIGTSQLNKFGIITYPTFNHTHTVVPLVPYNPANIASILKNIAQYPRLSPVINTHQYIKTLTELVDTKYARPPKAAIILLDEDSQSGTRSAIRAASLAAKDFGINMIAIGVGSKVTNSEMEAISYYSKRYTKRLSSHDQLESEGLKWTLDTLKTIEPIHLYRQAADELQDCDAAADITFSMDASMSLQENYFDAIKGTVIEVVKHLEMSPVSFRVREVTTFDGSVVVIAKDESDKAVLIQKIAAAELTGGVTKVYLAINRTIQAHLSQPIRDVEKIGVIITDGKSFDPHITRQEALAAAEANITLIALAIGDELSVSKSELMDVVANKSENIIWLKTFEDLRLHGPSRLHSHICNMVTNGSSVQTTATTTQQTTPKPTKPTTPVVNTTPKIVLITDDLCADCPIDSTGFGYVAHPTDCDRYIVCDSQRKIYSINNCPLDTFWDTKSTTCNHIHMTDCPNDKCKGKPDMYNYTTPRLLEDVATCDEYYTCLNERTSHVCECMFGIQKTYIEGMIAEAKYVGKRFDPTSNTCVDDPDGQCSTYIDPNEPVTPKVFTCTKTKLDDRKYMDDVTNQVVTCPDTYVYQPELCQCVQIIAPPNPGGSQPSVPTQVCKPFIKFTFDSRDTNPEIQQVPIEDEHSGGKFDGLQTGVQIYRLANNYDNQFTVQMELERTGSGNMMIFKNCLTAPTLSLYFEEAAFVVNVIAEMKTESGTLLLSVPSQDLKDNKKVFITLTTNENMAVLYVKNSAGSTSTDRVTFPSSGNDLDLSCNSLLTLGGRFEKGVKGFEGLLDEFWWFKGPSYGCTADSFLDSTIVSVVNQ